MGLSVHHAPATNIHLPPGDSLHIAIMMPFLDQSVDIIDNIYKILTC